MLRPSSRKEDAMADSPEYHGSLVAFEGESDAVTTQLRLLPRSPKILIIPSLQHFMERQDSDSPFDVRSYIMSIHEACKARTDMALSFLRDSSPNNKRLVFLNGGTASALASCIAAISQHETDGDWTRAEALFTQLVRDGIAGLKRQTKPSSAFGSAEYAETKQAKGEEGDPLSNDPMVRAMRAAEALDRKTASLQPNNDVDLTVAMRHRSKSVPIRRLANDFEETAPFYVFGAPSSEHSPPAQEIPRSFVDLGLLSPLEQHNRHRPTSRSCVGETYGTKSSCSDSAIDRFSPGATTSFDSIPNTPAVVFGEACVVNVRPFPKTVRPQNRIRSVDRVYVSAIHNQDISLCNFHQSTRPQDKRHLPTIITPDLEPPARQYSEAKLASEAPYITLFKPNKGMVRRDPPSPLDLSRPLTIRPSHPSYVDKGTNPETEYADKGTWIGNCYSDAGMGTAVLGSASPEDFELDADVPFEIALPLVEDLVIHFKDETRHPMLESVIQGFKEGTYPASIPPLLSRGREDSIPGTPTSRGSGSSDVHIAEPYHSYDDEYDPFASHGNYLHPPKTWPVYRGMTRNTITVVRPTPPTPVQTPPPAITVSDKYFDQLSTTSCRTAVCVQNSLRSILNVYFPPEDTGYHQFPFPQLPEISSLWKPLFRDTNTDSPKKCERKVDLILAVGAQRGVRKETLSAISTSLEKLGTKPNGINRSGRLDLRYLVANAMQAFTAQPLANQTQDNPFSNNLLLATLIIPHLETYMAAHSETRFLILEYPPDHLSTVLALQRLVGVDLLKVAGILSAESSQPGSLPRFQKPMASKGVHSNNSSVSSTSTASSRSGATLLAPTGMKSPDPPSFSKANFLITSSASDSEIATLISTIWKILIDISSFYVPDGAPRPSTSPRTKRNFEEKSEKNSFKKSVFEYAPLASAAVMMGFQTPPLSPSRTSIFNKKTSTPPPPPETATTIVKVQSPKTSMSDINKNSNVITTVRQRTKLQRMLGEKAVSEAEDNGLLRPDASGSYFDVSDDEMDQFADEERKYIPLYLKKPTVRRGSSRKALAWLGLS